jgi:hypothetical protein
MTDPTNAVSKALYTRLASALSPIRVYDAVPQDAAYPYVVIDSILATQADFLVARKDDDYAYLSIWSQYRGQKEVLDIIATIEAALHRTQLTMDTGRMIECVVADRRTERDADNLTFQGSVKLRIMVEH